MSTQGLGRLVGRAAVGASLAVLASTLLVAAVQLRHPTAAGFLHRHYDPPSRTLRQIVLSAHDGGVWFYWQYYRPPNVESRERWDRLMRERPRLWQRFDSPGTYTTDDMPLGFYFQWGRDAVRPRFLIFRLPYWFLAVASLVAPGVALRRRLRSRRRRRFGLCVRCGYDLRESPKICPERGAPASLA
jgi:hypothetical protein